MRLLILNWRCPRNPKAGGAEVVTYEIARRLVKQGDYIEWFAASFPGALAEEDLDGIRVIRAGRQWTVHWAAYCHYRGRLQKHFDAIIDEVNTIPFFTPLWADIPLLMFIHQLAREVWWYESPFPLNAVGYLAEPWYLRLYRRRPILTISPSTEFDLRRLGFDGPITIVPEGLEAMTKSRVVKESRPTFAYVGRLSASKRVADVIRAFAIFSAFRPGQLWIVGDGTPAHARHLRKIATRLRVEDEVKFLGRVSQEDKHNLMARAHALVLASAREGWGLVVIEANACGTPAVVYDVPGLRDAVRHEETGLVVAASPEDLAAGMLRLWNDRLLYDRVTDHALAWSQEFSFDRSAAVLRDAVVNACA